MGKAKRFNDYDAEVAASRRVIEAFALERQKLSVGSSFRSPALSPRTALAAGGGATSVTDPVVIKEVDLGSTLSGAVEVDWSLANKFRGIMTGNVTITFTNAPTVNGNYQQVVLELKQDGTGGRTVSFADSFENDHTPITAEAPNVYNVWAFFGSGRSGTPFFSFNTFQSIAHTVAMSDELTPLAAADADDPAATFRLPFPMTLTDVRASVRTTGAGSGIVTVDIHESGTTVLSTKITIDNGETTSESAAAPVVISDTTLADDALIEVFLDGRDGDNVATGLKCTLIGYIS